MKKKIIAFLAVLMTFVFSLAPTVSAADASADIPALFSDTDFLLKSLGISLLIGLAVGGITVLVMRSSMKTARQKHTAGNYLVKNSFELTHSSDTYLYTSVTRRRINNDNNGHGGRRPR